MAHEVAKNCLNCPSFLPAAETVGFFGKSVGIAQCARFGAILALPEGTTKEMVRTGELTAASCDSYGLERPTQPPEHPILAVTLPDVTARTELSDLDVMKKSVRTCTQCKHFVPDETVARERGFTAGLCRAQGTLIPANKRVDSARTCSYRQFGVTESATTEDLLILPQLHDPTFLTSPTLVDDLGMSVFVEPLDYPSDLDITDEDKTAGIKAWRKIEDPEGYGTDVYLPVFDPDSFTEQEIEYIPKTGDDNHPELYIDHGGKMYTIAALWTELDETPAMWGQPGVGKTEICYHLAWVMQIPFYRFPINEATELDELAGRKEYSPELGTHFVPGRLTRAWPNRSLILVDEPNTGRNEVWTFLRPLIDGVKALTLDIDDGRTLKRGLHTYLALAMNPAHDALNVGTNILGAADASRLMHVEMTLPPPDVERQIITNRVLIDGWQIDKDRLDLVMKVSDLLRDLCADGTLSMTWAVRENIKVARALRWFSPLTAYSVAGADYLEPAQREAFLDQVRASIPTKPFDPIKEIEKAASDGV